MSNKFSTIKERILYLLEIKGITKSKFFEKIGMTYGNFTGNSKKTPLNSDAIGNILLEIPDVNLEWLIIGKEPILREQPEAMRQVVPAESITIYKELLKEKEIEIKELCREVGALSNQNANLDKNLTALRLELECCKKENSELRSIINSQSNSSEDMPELPEIPVQLVAEPEIKYKRKNAQK
jgi:hypothetical protein